ncbi:MAG: site-2 protease family protein [Actinobacteria bacterium]|nr:site-2 protease family protein [Actinomycetota bacterium]
MSGPVIGGATPPPPPPPPPAESTSPVDGDVAETPGSHWLRVGLMALALVLLVRYTGWWGLAIVAGLVFMIFLHELGHFIMAKRAGMKVTEFFLGFGPRLWSVQRGETEYGIKAIPAGAYVQIIGMSMAEEVEAGDEDRTYRAKPFWQRFGVAVAGSTMHFIQALVLIFVILVFTGTAGGTLGAASSPSSAAEVGDVFASCPAAAAGIRPGDQIVAVDGQRLEHYSDLAPMVAPLANQTAVFQIRRDGVTREVPVHLVPRDDSPGSAAMIGVAYGPVQPKVERVGVVHAVPQTFTTFGSLMTQTIPAFFKAFSLSNLRSYGDQVVNAQQDRKLDHETTIPTKTTVPPAASKPVPEKSVTTSACRKSMGGPAAFKGPSSASSATDGRFLSIVGIFNIGRGMASSGGVADLLFLFVVVNIFIGVFNLIPMLPFDGGHVVIAVYEKIQEWRKRTGQRYYADMNKLAPVVYVMILLLGLLFVSSVYLDITNPISVK